MRMSRGQSRRHSTLLRMMPMPANNGISAKGRTAIGPVNAKMTRPPAIRKATTQAARGILAEITTYAFRAYFVPS